MANKRLTDGYTCFGANFVYSQGAGGLWDLLDHFQDGKLYITGVNETKASGTFEVPWTEATDPNCITITPRIDPTGRYYVSSMDNEGFVVTFTSTPVGLGYPWTFPVHVADWFACM